MPQGSPLGLLSFLLLIDDLTVDCLTHQYVDDTTFTELLPRGSQQTHMQTFLQQLQLIIEAILDSVIICVDVSTKFSSVACNCVKVQWLESKESTSIHQPINFINFIKQTWGETSTVGGETSSEWAKRQRGETSCYRWDILRPVLLYREHRKTSPDANCNLILRKSLLFQYRILCRKYF